jgi:hypothetical protein
MRLSSVLLPYEPGKDLLGGSHQYGAAGHARAGPAPAGKLPACRRGGRQGDAGAAGKRRAARGPALDAGGSAGDGAVAGFRCRKGEVAA